LDVAEETVFHTDVVCAVTESSHAHLHAPFGTVTDGVCAASTGREVAAWSQYACADPVRSVGAARKAMSARRRRHRMRLRGTGPPEAFLCSKTGEVDRLTETGRGRACKDDGMLGSPMGHVKVTAAKKSGATPTDYAPTTMQEYIGRKTFAGNSSMRRVLRPGPS
jgi:hypothetical protein